MDTSKLQGRRFNNQEELLEALKVLYAEDKIEYTRQRGADTQFPINENDQWIILNDCLDNAGGAAIIFSKTCGRLVKFIARMSNTFSISARTSTVTSRIF